MRRRLLSPFALLLLSGLASAAPTSVVLLGDSITNGSLSAPLGPSYEALLVDSLGAGFQISNIACGGSSSLDWTRSRGDAICGSSFVLPNLYEGRALQELPAELVTILLGTNDAIGFFEPAPIEPSAYRSAIEELVLDLQDDGAGRILLMTPPPNPAFSHLAGLLGAYRDEILALCAAPGDAVLCGPDVFTLLTPEDFASGNSHPNAYGHAKIAAALHDAILAAVPEPGAGALFASGLAALALRRAPAAQPTRAPPAG
jgi:lysophospholipase L1-like esterase